MKPYLIKTVETYRFDNEKDAEAFVTELKRNGTFEVAKYSCTKKERKQKGEIIDEWYRLEVTKVFQDEKEPNDQIMVRYDSATKIQFEAAEDEDDG